MKKISKFLSFFLGTSLLLGGLVAALNMKANNVNEAKADAEVNDKFDCIYSDAWNNIKDSNTSKRVLLTYIGTKNGFATDTVIDSATVGNKILLNGIAFSEFGADAMIKTWGGQNWFHVIYPNSVVESGEGSTLEIMSGLTVGDSVCDHVKFTLNSSGLWRRTFTDAVNSTYQDIYSNDYNNGTHATGYNRLMFKYTGVAHNGATINGAEQLKNYDNYILIDGTPLSTYAGGSTQIAPWSGLPWLQIIYPDTAISVGSTLVINEGCQVGDAVFEKIVFKLNDSSKWEKLTLIEDDSLVRDGDYKLFTLSDYPFTVNDAGGYMFYAGSDFVDAMSDSFGFRFIVNIPEGQLANAGAGTLKFACANIYGSSPIVSITLNYSNNVYLTFNGSIDWSTSIVHSWSEGVDHLVEVYFIKTSSTTAKVLLGIDNSLIFKSADKDISGLTFHNFFTTSGPTDKGAASYYSSATDTTNLAISRFGSRKLHSNDVSFGDNRDTGNCLGYYAGAKAFYTDYLTKNQKVAFATSGPYANLKNRLVAWAAANGENISFNGSTGAIEVARANFGFEAIVNDDNNYLIIAIISSLIVVTTFAGYFFLRRKRQ